MSHSLSGDELLTQLEEYVSAVDAVLSIIENESYTDESLFTAASRLSEFGPLMERLEAGDLPAGSDFQAALKSARLKHGLLSGMAVERQTEIGEALTKVRETRRKTNFYGPSGSEVGVSCDMSG